MLIIYFLPVLATTVKHTHLNVGVALESGNQSHEYVWRRISLQCTVITSSGHKGERSFRLLQHCLQERDRLHKYLLLLLPPPQGGKFQLMSARTKLLELGENVSASAAMLPLIVRQRLSHCISHVFLTRMQL